MNVLHHAATPAQTAVGAQSLADHARLVGALRNPAVFGPEVEQVDVLETHISTVLLTGRLAYKLKKPVDLGFLDFTTLSARRHFCEEELRLNRRLAPRLYLDVVAITGSLDAPAIGGAGPPVEYAVKMREFPQEGLLGGVLARGELEAGQIDALAAQVAIFHGQVEIAGEKTDFGTPEEILRFALQNFAQIRPLVVAPTPSRVLDRLERWTVRTHRSLESAFGKRRHGGFVRECHGDLHLGNIALVDGELTIFDCLEFNDELRWIDVMSEVAFVVMDLHDRGRAAYAHRFLNAYLEASGDYAGLVVLRFYLVYRALVRAKVACLRAAQLGPGEERSRLMVEFGGYLELAQGYATAGRGGIVITHGLAGSGKTTLTQSLLERIGAIRLRSDVERKRLHGFAASARTHSPITGGLYAEDATEHAYARLAELAGGVVQSGYIAIVDATFLKRTQRDRFRELAAMLGVPFVMVAFSAGEGLLRERIAAREREGGDVSEADIAVLEHQLRTREVIAADEQRGVVRYDAEAPLEEARCITPWQDVLQRLEVDSVVGAAPADPGLAAKVAFLSNPHAYPGGTARVDSIETHMSWVFLTDHHAWKLKKPVCHGLLDFGTLEARRRDCEEELRLNRRLTRDVYLETVPLALGERGGLRLGGAGRTIDWLVKMRRLPAKRMLARAIQDDAVRDADILRVVEALARVYRESGVAMDPEGYRRRLVSQIRDNRRVLCRPEWNLVSDPIEATCSQQAAFVEKRAALFDERVRAGWIVEGHGDLRPEHICLLPEPQIIDCLEFSKDLRMADAADELAFLALECERLGASRLRQTIFDAWSAASGDAPPPAIVDFYQSYRAVMRAKIAIWHLKEPQLRDDPRWAAQARDYLRLARERIDR